MKDGKSNLIYERKSENSYMLALFRLAIGAVCHMTSNVRTSFDRHMTRLDWSDSQMFSRQDSA